MQQAQGAQRLQDLLQLAGISGRELSRRVGKHSMWTNDRLQGRVAINLEDLERICDALEITSVEFLAGGIPARYADRWNVHELTPRQRTVLSATSRLVNELGLDEGDEETDADVVPPDVPEPPSPPSPEEEAFTAAVLRAARRCYRPVRTDP